MTGQLKAGVKLLVLALWIALCCALAWPAKLLSRIDWRDRAVCLCYRGILRIIGLHLAVDGQLSERRPLLLVTNHLSYLDVALLGSCAAVRFTPKSDIGAWPVIGWICRLCDAVFIDRRAEKVGQGKAAMQASLASGAVMCLFPESSTGNGLHLLPFKPAFFSLAEEPINGMELIVQPAALTYTSIRRLPVDHAQWPQIAWYGDMELMPHLWELLKLGPIGAKLTFLPPVSAGEYGNRKQLAAYCQKAIASAIEAMRGTSE